MSLQAVLTGKGFPAVFADDLFHLILRFVDRKVFDQVINAAETSVAVLTFQLSPFVGNADVIAVLGRVGFTRSVLPQKTTESMSLNEPMNPVV
jgi:hypothetical protein